MRWTSGPTLQSWIVRLKQIRPARAIIGGYLVLIAVTVVLCGLLAFGERAAMYAAASKDAEIRAATLAEHAGRGFAAVEAYPDLTLGADAQSGASPQFWHGLGFVTAVDDERFPVMRREL